jgi:transcriptional regulator with XRE-family HTH domain
MTEKELLKKMGARIKELRTSKGVTQQELAVEAFNTDKSNVSRLESGRVNASVYTLYKVAQYLKVPLTDLLAFEDEIVKPVKKKRA